MMRLIAILVPLLLISGCVVRSGPGRSRGASTVGKHRHEHCHPKKHGKATCHDHPHTHPHH